MFLEFSSPRSTSGVASTFSEVEIERYFSLCRSALEALSGVPICVSVENALAKSLPSTASMSVPFEFPFFSSDTASFSAFEITMSTLPSSSPDSDWAPLSPEVALSKLAITPSLLVEVLDVAH